MLHTPLSRQYGLDHPLISAGMGFISMPPLVIAVCNAGAMGVLGLLPHMPGEVLRQNIRAVRAETAGTFGVDLITRFTTDEYINVCVEEHVPVVVFFWDDPPRGHIARLRAAGIKVWVQVGSVEGARQAVDAGADAVIAQGSEAGGHNLGQAGLFALLPAMVDAVSPVPVVAAGGIGDGRGVAAALALGAHAVSVGSRFVASQEANAHLEYKRRIVAATTEDTAFTTMFGPEWPDARTRVLRNRVVREWAGREKEIPASAVPHWIGKTRLHGQEVPMPKFSVLLPTPETEGDFEEMCLLAGEGVGLIQEIRPAADIVREMMSQAEKVIAERLVGMMAAGRTPKEAIAS